MKYIFWWCCVSILSYRLVLWVYGNIQKWANWRLLWTADVDLWSNSMGWCGSKSYHPHTSVEWPDNEVTVGMALPASGHPRSSPAPLLLSSSSAWTRRIEWPKYKNNWGIAFDATIVTWNWSSCCNVICVCWMVRRRLVVTRWLAVTSGPFRRHQMTGFEIVIAVLHCLSYGWHVGLLCTFL